MRSIIATLFVSMLLGCAQLYGQETRKEVSVRFVTGSSTLNSALGDNAAHLQEIISFLENVQNDNTLELTEVSFSGFASPDGGFRINSRLAAQRLQTLEAYVRSKISIPDNIITRQPSGIAWSLLAELTEQSDMPYKDEAVDVLRNVPEFTYNAQGAITDSRKKHLMELRWGRTWNYMASHFFAQMRNAGAIMVSVKQQPEPEPIIEEPVVEDDILPTDTVPAEEPQTPAVIEPAKKSSSFVMAVKTNMLYDVLAVPNIGLEFYLGNNWSLGGNWMYGWWDKSGSDRYWRIYGGDIALRKWFGKAAAERPLTGHHLGLYAQAFTYDFEWGGKGYMGGKPGGTLWDKANYAAGVEYGYSLPIARKLNIDFTLGVGYWGGKYYKYTPLDDHYVWQATRNRHWFGPTKAEVSLVWLLGQGFNSKKGGVK